MARKKPIVHKAIINQKTAEAKYGKNRFWFYHRRMCFTPIDPHAIGLSARCTWYYEDEIMRLLRHPVASRVLTRAS
jgi:hypothetical protein